MTWVAQNLKIFLSVFMTWVGKGSDDLGGVETLMTWVITRNLAPFGPDLQVTHSMISAGFLAPRGVASIFILLVLNAMGNRWW